ncbi:hypothetical protein F5887DRAFT_989800 [Amanita rubescens]|nr:hypothetical protein F5887DRAFT_989800 [Amanita rubescens]
MPLLSLVLMPSRSSSSPRSRDKASRPIDSDVYRDYPNAYIEWLELWKEKVEPEHEYVLIITDKGDKYRIERRPSEGANIHSKLRGCDADDIITRILDDGNPTRLATTKTARREVLLRFYHDPQPDLYTVFAFCDAIRRDRDAQKYTLTQFNCYFFARTLTLLVTRHTYLRQYFNIYEGSRREFRKLPEYKIDEVVADLQLTYEKSNKERWIFMSPSSNKLTYEGLRLQILEMNEKHCKRVTQLGGNGDEVYATLDEKKEKIWRRMYTKSDPQVPPNIDGSDDEDSLSTSSDETHSKAGHWYWN